MEKIYLDILNSENVELDYKRISNKKLKSFYSFFIATMFFYHLIDISVEFASNLYIDIINDNEDINCEKIIEFIYNKEIEKETKLFEDGNFD